MIISKTFGVVYVAVPKTASQSMSQMLEQHLKISDCRYEAESLHDWHANMEEAIEITPLPLENYWTFAFVRNPYDRFISYCAGHVEGFDVSPALAIEKGLEDVLNQSNRWVFPQSYFLGGIRKVYRYEFMNEALDDLSQRIGRDLSDLPRLNVGERSQYAGYYDENLKAVISDVYKSDLLNLDYRF